MGGTGGHQRSVRDAGDMQSCCAACQRNAASPFCPWGTSLPPGKQLQHKKMSRSPPASAGQQLLSSYVTSHTSRQCCQTAKLAPLSVGAPSMPPSLPAVCSQLTADTFRPRIWNFLRYPLRDFVELLVTKMSFLPCRAHGLSDARTQAVCAPSWCRVSLPVTSGSPVCLGRHR